jgi:hypothetical protein
MNSPRTYRSMPLPGPFWMLPLATASAQIRDLGTTRVPTLAPLVKEVTPAVVNISPFKEEFERTIRSTLILCFVSSSTFRSNSKKDQCDWLA